jgi:hypothetical protein
VTPYPVVSVSPLADSYAAGSEIQNALAPIPDEEDEYAEYN